MNLSFHCSSSFSPDSLRADSEKQRSDLHSLKKTSFLGISVDSFGRGTSSSSSLFCPSSSLESRGSLLSLMSEESCCSPLSSSERKTRSLCYDETGVPDTLDVCRVYVHQGIEQHEDSNALRRNSPVKMIYITSSNRKTPPSHSTPPPPSEISCFPSSSSSSSPSEDLQLSPQHSSASSSVSSPFSSSPLVCNLPFSSSSSSPSFLRPPSSLLLPLAFLLLHSSSQLSPHPSSSFSSFSSSSSSFSLAVWLSRNLEGTLPSLTKASAKKVVGLSRGSIYEPIVDFCFTIPEGSKGQIKAQTMISSPGHELIILNRTESEALSIINNSPDFSSSSSSSSYYYSDRDHTICRRLIDNARVREPLVGGVPREFQSGVPSLYELVLSVDPNLNQHHVTAWLTRCVGREPVDAMYSIHLMNPGSFWVRHFSCEDQGLLQVYLFTLLVTAICGLSCFSTWKNLEERRSFTPTGGGGASSSSSHGISSLTAGSACAVALYFLSVLLYSIHLISYASDGSGLSVLKFLSQLFEGCMRGLVFVLIASIVTRHAPGGSTSSSGSSGGHSDSRISSSSYQHPQHAFAVKVSGIFLVCQLVYILAESQAYTSVSAYARLRSCWGAILLLGNLCAAIFIFLVTANSSSLGSLDIVSTRTFYVNFATGCILYYLTPVLLVVFFTGSVLMDTIVLLLTEFVAVNILYRVLSRPVGGGGAGSLTALPSSSSFSGGSKPFPIISLQEAYHPYTDL